MDANEYQRLAMRTSSEHDTPAHRLVNAVLGLAGEAGELAASLEADMSGDPLSREVLRLIAATGGAAERLKKARYHGHPLDYDALSHQVADIIDPINTIIGVIDQEAEHGAPPRQLLRLAYDVPELTLELGDTEWYVAQSADALGVLLGEVMEANIRKLEARYPQGFSSAASLNRAEG